MRDLRLAIRSVRAAPIVSIVAALSLALGIGAKTAIFSLVNGLLLRAPVKDGFIRSGSRSARSGPLCERRRVVVHAIQSLVVG